VGEPSAQVVLSGCLAASGRLGSGLHSRGDGRYSWLFADALANSHRMFRLKAPLEQADGAILDRLKRCLDRLVLACQTFACPS